MIRGKQKLTCYLIDILNFFWSNGIHIQGAQVFH